MLAITDQEFESIRKIMYARTGVNLKETKKPLVFARLRKRIEELRLESFAQYVHILEKNDSAELEYFSNALTTNETFFFRHARQFNFLYENVLPAYKREGRGKIAVWSAACSKGDEPYSLAIALQEFKDKGGPDFSILASDINTDVIQEAKDGVYDERSLKDVPESLKAKYFKATAEKGCLRISEAIRRKVEFTQHNLKAPLKSGGPFDVIFLRNVLIYFDRATKETVVTLASAHLKPEGYFFISLSENLNDIHCGLQLVESGIFKKK